MMEGQMLALGPCWGCGILFEFDPDWVPSIPVDPRTNLSPDLCTCGEPEACNERAVKQPICPDCMARREQARGGGRGGR
jgi:hypothetical protein